MVTLTITGSHNNEVDLGKDAHTGRKREKESKANFTHTNNRKKDKQRYMTKVKVYD